MDKKWRVGLVGVGRGSGYGRLLAMDSRCEVTACCDASSAALERFGRELGLSDSHCFTDYGAFVDAGLDLVFLGTPIPLHAQEAIAALEAGCHVLSEVTAASTVEDCGRIVDAVRRTGKRYMLAENCVYWHFVSQWRDLVAAGKLGRLVHAECEYLHPIPELIYDRKTGANKWRTQRAPAHYCSHSLGPILEVTGDRIVRGCGFGSSHHVLPEVSDIGGIDFQVALFETAAGMSIKMLRTSLLPRGRGLHYYSLHGSRGFIETDRAVIGGVGRYYVAGETAENTTMEMPISDASLPESTRAGGHGTAEYMLLQDFLGALERDERPHLDEVRAMDLTVPGLVAHESAMRGSVWLDVPSFA